MADHRRYLSAAEAAAALGVGKSWVRDLFDAVGPAAGTRDPETGERQFDPAWVAAQAELRSARRTRTVAGTLSVAEAAAQLRVSPNTVRRWFDRDQPGSGTVIANGRTGTSERRCSTVWLDALRPTLRSTQAPPQ